MAAHAQIEVLVFLGFVFYLAMHGTMNDGSKSMFLAHFAPPPRQLSL
jgi:hypothetical protein